MHVVLFLLLLLFSGTAEAHRPYLVRQTEVQAPSGEPVIVEKLYGDGIFVADPVRLQLRSQNGALLAYTPVSRGNISYICPHIKFCWAFAFNAFTLFSAGYLLDPSAVQWSSAPQVLKLNPDEALSFRQYLAGRADYVAAESFGYPEAENEPGQHFKQNWAGLFLSPLAIVAQYTVFLFLLAGLSFAVQVVTRALLIKWRAGGLLALVIIYPAVFLLVLAAGLYQGIPMAYALAFWCLGFWAARDNTHAAIS